MPEYLFEQIDTGEQKAFFYTMKEVPKVSTVVEIDGNKWRRIFTLPQAAPNGLKAIDPHSQKAFREKTGAMKGTVGDLWSLSKELSEKRAEKEGGTDSVKEKYYTEFSKRRRGTPHPSKLAENQRKAQKKLNDGLNKIAKQFGLD
jgi:hypothetical protein